MSVGNNGQTPLRLVKFPTRSSSHERPMTKLAAHLSDEQRSTIANFAMRLDVVADRPDLVNVILKVWGIVLETNGI